jgi:hypothetical protein
MNPITASPEMALTIAHRTMQDRREDAALRAQRRDARRERRARLQGAREWRRLSAKPSTPTMPWWAVRYLHPSR